MLRARGQLERINLSIAQVAKFTLAVWISALTDHPFAVSLFVRHEHLFFGSGQGMESAPGLLLPPAETPRYLGAAAEPLFGRENVSISSDFVTRSVEVNAPLGPPV